MALRTVYWFEFMGFRIAGRSAGALERHRLDFDKLEAAVAETKEHIQGGYALTAFDEAGGWSARERPLGDQTAAIQTRRTIEPAGNAEVLLAGVLPFRKWPFGGLVVFDGFSVTPDGRFGPLSEETLMELW